MSRKNIPPPYGVPRNIHASMLIMSLQKTKNLAIPIDSSKLEKKGTEQITKETNSRIP